MKPEPKLTPMEMIFLRDGLMSETEAQKTLENRRKQIKADEEAEKKIYEMMFKTEDGVDWKDLQVGNEVYVFDNRLYKNDKVTPLSMTMQRATIIKVREVHGEPMVDVKFLRDGFVSHGHFVWGISTKMPDRAK